MNRSDVWQTEQQNVSRAGDQITSRNLQIQLTITILPDLHQALQDNARIYAETYGREEPIGELVPAIPHEIVTHVLGTICHPSVRVRQGQNGGAGGIRTLDTLLAYTHFPGERLRPLGHRSACAGRHAPYRASRFCASVQFANPAADWQENGRDPI